MQKFKVNRQSVPKIEWIQIDGQIDRGNCIISHANAVGKNTVFITQKPAGDKTQRAM